MKQTNITMKSALESLQKDLGISEQDFGGKLIIEGNDPVIGSRHYLGESTAVLLGLFGMELAAIWKLRTGKSQDIKVNVRNAMCNLAAIVYAKQNGVTIAFDDEGLVETTDFFKCKDGRWVFIVCSMPRLRQIACEVLECQATKTAFAKQCLKWNALELENAMNEAKGCCCMVRTREEWFASKQAKHTMSDPLISIEKIGDSVPMPLTNECELPLSGIKILDNTQIYAAPICTRYAADAGADVLHLLTPTRLNPNRMDSEVMPGKRSAWCDFNDEKMKAQFMNLVEDADIFVNNTINLESKGITPEILAKKKPGIICVELRCYGFAGPWATRGGFEQHAQCCTGFNVEEGSFDNPISPPTYLLNDTMCGLEASIGMLEALRRRATEGGSYLVKVSLARNCAWMQDFGLISDENLVGLPKNMLSSPGLNATVRPEYDLPLVKAQGPRGEVEVVVPQVEFSEFQLGPSFSGDNNGASYMDWSIFNK